MSDIIDDFMREQKGIKSTDGQKNLTAAEMHGMLKNALPCPVCKKQDRLILKKRKVVEGSGTSTYYYVECMNCNCECGNGTPRPGEAVDLLERNGKIGKEI